MSGFFSQPRAVWAVAFAAVVSFTGRRGAGNRADRLCRATVRPVSDEC